MDEEKSKEITNASKYIKEQIDEAKEEEVLVDEMPDYPWNRDVRRRVLGLKKYNFSRRIFKGKRIQGLAEKIMTTTIRDAQLKQILNTPEE